MKKHATKSTSIQLYPNQSIQKHQRGKKDPNIHAISKPLSHATDQQFSINTFIQTQITAEFYSANAHAIMNIGINE